MVAYICDKFQNLSAILFNFFNLFNICVFIYLFFDSRGYTKLKILSGLCFPKAP